MTTIDEALRRLRHEVDRMTIETYVEHAWIQPHPGAEGWDFEDIDIARIDLVTHLRRDMDVNDEAMDLVLSLLDQLYDMKSRVRRIRGAVEGRPEYESHPLAVLIAELWREN
jgi:chaperone modulatory protein CbpM